jgi:hypothetical protein
MTAHDFAGKAPEIILSRFAELAIAVTFMEFSMPIFGISNLQFPREVFYWKLEIKNGDRLKSVPNEI